MGVQRKMYKAGNGVDFPKKGDNVTIEYTGNLYDEAAGAAADYRGAQYVLACSTVDVYSEVDMFLKVRQLGWSRPFYDSHRDWQSS